MKSTTAMYLRSVIFGINDSLVSTVGFLAGISVAGVPRTTVILTGIVYALVEAFSMATGNYLSEEASQEYIEKANVQSAPSIISGVVMFFSSFLAALIPLTPYLFIASETALFASAGISILGLFVLGGLTAHFSKLPVFWRSVRMAVVGGLSIGLGILVGSFFPKI